LGSLNLFLFTVTNSGSQATAITSSVLSSAFTYEGGSYPGTSGDCGVDLAGGASCTLAIVYTPNTLGAESDIVTIGYVDGVGPQTTNVNLRGTAVNTALIDISEVDTYDFGDVALNGVTQYTFILTNNGGFEASNITESALGADFRFLDGSFPGTGGDCGSSIGASDVCRIVVEFNPQSVAVFNYGNRG